VSVALVTGATGLVGSHIIDRLIADGWSVRALARAPGRATVLLPRVDVVPGDVLDEASFTRAASGCDVVFHAAANITVSGWAAFRLTNVEGTRNAILAAEKARARLLHVSSVAVYGPSARYDAARRGERTDETTILQPLPERSYYARSKRESEQLVLRAHQHGQVWATVVRPSVVYGPRDRQFVPRMATLIRRAAIPLLKGGRTTMGVVHAANVAQGSVLAATTDIAGGKAYNLANDYDVTVRQFFELAGEGLGRRPLWIPMPMWAAKGVMKVAKRVIRLVSGGRLNVGSNSALSFISEDNPFSSDLAKRELGWAPSMRPEIGIPAAFRWWRENERARRIVAPLSQ
jgi:2-alkyl-3-oxoalkanoate reductase